MVLAPHQIPFIGADGKVHKIVALSLVDRQYFEGLHSMALQIIGDRDIAIAYDCDTGFRAAADALLLLSGISPAWVDAHILASLLFGIGDTPAILVELNLPKAKADASADQQEDLSTFDPDAWAIATIWSADGSLANALDVAKEYPATWVHEVLRCRSKQVQMADPEYKKERSSRETKERFSRTLQEYGSVAAMRESIMKDAREIEL